MRANGELGSVTCKGNSESINSIGIILPIQCSTASHQIQSSSVKTPIYLLLCLVNVTVPFILTLHFLLRLVLLLLAVEKYWQNNTVGCSLFIVAAGEQQ